MLDSEQCWQALVNRDAHLDGQFVYGVRTTGVYCRPSCPSRQPLRKNVMFYATSAEAEQYGFRACKRCHPKCPMTGEQKSIKVSARVRELCRYIDQHADHEALTLDFLADRAGLSRFQLHRSFRLMLGLTPRQYVEAARLRHLKHALRNSPDVTNAVFDAGFGSMSRVYERADIRLGMTPKQYRLGAPNMCITYATADTDAGLMMIGATDRGLCFVQFGDLESDLLAELQREYPNAECTPMRQPEPAEFRQWIDSLRSHLEGRQPHLQLPTDIRATAFQMTVWTFLQKIPYGEVQSYSEVAEGIGKPGAARAVARACASNRLALVIPCHRVIRGTGELGGYRWGLARKRWLIERESAGSGMAVTE